MKVCCNVTHEYDVWSIKTVAKMCVPQRGFVCSKNECTFI